MLPPESDAGRALARTLTGVVLAAATAACGARQWVPPAPDPIPGILEQAGAEVRAGCYRCLERATRLYAQVPSAHPAAAAAARGRLGAMLLLAARARELGLPDTEWLELTRAATAASDDPLAALRLEIVTRIQRPLAAASPAQLEDDRAAARQGVEGVAAAAASNLAALARHDPVDAYLVLALACENFGLAVPGPEALPPAIAAVPLVAFKIGVCWREHRDALERAYIAEPRFVEARAWRGEQARRQGRLVTADRELRAALEAFPDLAMASLALGQVGLLLEEPGPAAAAFDRVLALVPDHPQALLGRTEALTLLGHAPEAMATADRLLEAGTWFQGEAHYWRAWNLRRLRRLEEAAEAVARADQLLFNAAVPKLAGFIAYERDLLDRAQRELETSRERRASDCEVLFGLGQVHARRGEWRDSAPLFVEAADCARGAQEGVRVRMTELDVADLDAARKAKMRARLERNLRAAHDQEGLAAISAAGGFVLAGLHAEARLLARRAAGWEAHRARAAGVLAGLEP